MRRAFYLFVLFLGACQSDRAPARATPGPDVAADSGTAAPAPAGEALSPLVPDPPLGRWRLADPSDMDHVVFWLSHILIRHSEAARPDDVPFNYGNWRLSAPRATRSRAAALLRAQELSEKAQRDPASFPDLARQFSEDAVTKDAGGSLGGMSAVMFLLSPQFLDALQETKVGGVTRVLESPQGFHLFLRRPPPAEQQVSGDHIVIGHDDAPAISMFARRTVPRRTRTEALALAQRVYNEARQDPDSFRQLGGRYSDYEDAASGGDVGSWSTREVTQIPREIETLANLSVGQVAPPLDTVYGFQILKRTANRPRAEWAMARVELHFEPSQLVGEESRGSVLSLARTLLASIAGDPERFAEVEKKYCCTNVLRVTEGRFSRTVEGLLARLEPGQVAPEPMLYGGSVYLLVQRLPASKLPPVQPTLFELDSPERPDLGYLMRSRSGPLIDKGVLAFAAKARTGLALDAARADALARLHQSARFTDLAESEREARLAQLQTSVHELLGPADSRRYDELLLRHLEELMYQSGVFSNTGEN